MGYTIPPPQPPPLPEKQLQCSSCGYKDKESIYKKKT